MIRSLKLWARQTCREGRGARDWVESRGHDQINHACVMRPPSKLWTHGGVSWLVSTLICRRAMCPDSSRTGHVSCTSGTPSDLALCILSIWLFLSCILYNKTEVVSIALLVSSVSWSNKLLKLRESWEPLKW